MLPVTRRPTPWDRDSRPSRSVGRRSGGASRPQQPLQTATGVPQAKKLANIDVISLIFTGTIACGAHDRWKSAIGPARACFFVPTNGCHVRRRWRPGDFRPTDPGLVWIGSVGGSVGRSDPPLPTAELWLPNLTGSNTLGGRSPGEMASFRNRRTGREQIGGEDGRGRA